MEFILKPFCQENWLQILDHIVTVLFGIASFILAIIIYKLSNKDKTKTIAINELQAQTKKLEEIYLHQLQPRFIVNTHSSSQLKFTNIGGDCYNLKVTIIKEQSKNEINPFNWDNTVSRMEEKIIYIGNLPQWTENVFEFLFEDIFGNSFKQILYTPKTKFSEVKKCNDH